MNRKKIAVLMASADREYQQDFIRGVFHAAALRNMDVFVFNCQGHMNVSISASDSGESAIFDLAQMTSFDGVISLRETLADEVSMRKVEQILHQMAQKPHVSIDVPANGAVSILFDDSVSVRKMTEHLIQEHGARKVFFLSGPSRHLVSITRLEACRQAMQRFDLELKPEDVMEGEWIQRSGEKCVEKLLSKGNGLPDVIVCANDDMAFGVIECLYKHGIKVPGDVLVTGFDAIRDATARGVTTIRRPIDLMAQKAVETLDAWMNGEKPETWDIVLPTIPIYGDTCGCRQNWEQMQEMLHSLGSVQHHIQNTLVQISMFSGNLASVGDEMDAHLKIDQFVQTLGIQEIYLCMDPALSRDHFQSDQRFAYPDEMLLLYGRKEGYVFPVQLFKTEKMVPDVPGREHEARQLIFCPLYYRSHNFGYMALEAGAVSGSALYSVLMLLNGSLMSLFLQTSLRNYALKVEEMAVQDIMTGMQNRRGFTNQAPKMLEEARKKGKFFVLLSADMDFMKQINDRHGHLMGDEAICRMGRAMKKLAEKGLIPVHISGDEFLAYGLKDSEKEAKDMLNAALEAVRKLNEEEPWIEKTSASFGLYTAIPGEKDGLDEFMTRADQAMYEVKNQKKKNKTAVGEVREP